MAPVPLRINSGGWDKSFTTPEGKVWLTDRYSVGGYNRYRHVPTASEWEVWSTTRDGDDFSYRIPLNNGSYNVTLRFVDVLYTTKGARNFDVSINGSVVLDNLDIVGEAGFAQPLIKKLTNISVANGMLTITLLRGSGPATIAGIEVERGTGSTPPPPPPPAVSVSVSPTPVNLKAGQTQQFQAAVTGSTNQAVTWSLSSSLANPGSISGTGLYTAPSSIAQSGGVTVKATAAASSSASGTAQVNLATAVSVSCSPKSATVTAGQTAQFAASVTGTSNTQVNWTASAGTISSAGLLTAPTVTSPTQVVVTAKSAVDANVLDTAQVTVNPVSGATPPPPPTGTGAFLEQNGTVSLEAERSTIANVGSVHWQVASAKAGFSGTGYLNSSVNTGNIFSTNFTSTASGGWFNVRFNKTGTYYIWVRGLGGTYSDDSIHVGLDGAVVPTATQISAFDIPNKAWSWAGNQMDAGRATIVVTSAGQHKVNFWMREDGFMFDKLLLTTDQSFVPQGLGPAESPTDSSTPILNVSPLTMGFTAISGGSNPASQIAQITNGGGSTLNFTASSNQPWLGISAASGSAPFNLTVQPSTSGLGAGVHKGSITVSASGLPAKTIDVTFTVGAPQPPTLSVTPGSLSFAALQGGANPPGQQLSVTNAGSGSISWTASSDKTWLTISPPSGSAPATISVNASMSGLSAGSHQAVVTITSAGAAGSPRTVGVTFSIQAPSAGRGFYAAPNGSSSGDGSIGRPWDIQTAFNHPAAVKPGDTIWLRGGRYGNGGYMNVYLNGTAAQPVTVRQYPGERATINGGLGVYGTYSVYWGFEVAQTGNIDRWTQAYPPGVNAFAIGNKFINLIVHDTLQGMSLWRSAPDTEAYGNIIYNNGYQASDRGHGHGIYTQNREGKKVIHDNIIFNQFSFGIHAYGSDAAFVQNYDVQGNISFGNGTISSGASQTDNILLAVGSSMENIKVDNNYTYFKLDKNQGQNRLSWPNGGPHKDVYARGNYFIGGQAAMEICNWATADVRNNVTYSKAGFPAWLCTDQGQNPRIYTWNNNTYYGVDNFRRGSTTMRFAEWKANTGMDANSVYTPGRPTGIWKFVRPNKYEAGRGHIVIYNWDLASTVGVDIGSVVGVGKAFEIRNAQDYFAAPVVTGTYNGGSVSIPMTGLTVAQPGGFNKPTQAAPTGPEFGAFVIITK